MADANDHLSEIATSIPPVNLDVLTIKHCAFLAQVFMEEVELGGPTLPGSDDNAVSSIRATDGLTGGVPGANSSPNNMPVSEHELQTLQQVLRAKAQGMEGPILVSFLGVHVLALTLESLLKHKARTKSTKLLRALNNPVMIVDGIKSAYYEHGTYVDSK